jgi:hypothetical protein
MDTKLPDHTLKAGQLLDDTRLAKVGRAGTARQPPQPGLFGEARSRSERTLETSDLEAANRYNLLGGQTLVRETRLTPII